MTTTNAITNETIPADTLVVSTLDGEPGRIVRPASFNRNRTRVWSYSVITNDGREIWDACDIVRIDD